MVLEGFYCLNHGQSNVRVASFIFDGTLLFCDADVSQLTFIRHILIWLQVVSKLKINLRKCKITLMGEAINNEYSAQVLSCKVGPLLTIYLVLLLGASIILYLRA